MKSCLIVSGGDFCSLPTTIKYDYVIACDKGLSYAKQLNITPDLILGDFDSYADSLDSSMENVLVYPVQKDDSDTMLAIKEAIKRGFEHLIIICALGGRLDHTIANIQSMAYAASHNTVCEIYSDHEQLISFTGPEITIPAKEGYSFSLFALSDKCENLSIQGSAYDVDNVTLNNSFPLGLSNYWKEENIRLQMSSGILLIVMSSVN